MNAIRLGGQVLAVLLSAGVALPTWAGSEAETTSAAPVQAIRAVDPYFAKVDGKIITIRDYRDVYNATMRKRYYHAKPPEDEADAVRKEIADILIVRELVIGDAERNGIQPQEENIKLIMANTDASYSAKPEWQRQRERLLSELKTQLTRKSLYEQNEKKLHEVPAPSKEEVRAYYEKRPDLFTEPARQRLSVILLKVDPGAPKQDWESAVAKEKEIYQRIKDGASFAEMAKQYSAHASAKMGGDMGYVHRGMLPDQLQEKIDQSRIGEVTEPFRILEGIAMYRVDERSEAKLQDFAAVAQRAEDLLKRERSEQAWKDAIARLRAAAKIEILVPLSGAEGRAVTQ